MTISMQMTRTHYRKTIRNVTSFSLQRKNWAEIKKKCIESYQKHKCWLNECLFNTRTTLKETIALLDTSIQSNSPKRQ